MKSLRVLTNVIPHKYYVSRLLNGVTKYQYSTFRNNHNAMPLSIINSRDDRFNIIIQKRQYSTSNNSVLDSTTENNKLTKETKDDQIDDGALIMGLGLGFMMGNPLLGLFFGYALSDMDEINDDVPNEDNEKKNIDKQNPDEIESQE